MHWFELREHHVIDLESRKCSPISPHVEAKRRPCAQAPLPCRVRFHVTGAPRWARKGRRGVKPQGYVSLAVGLVALRSVSRRGVGELLEEIKSSLRERGEPLPCLEALERWLRCEAGGVGLGAGVDQGTAAAPREVGVLSAEAEGALVAPWSKLALTRQALASLSEVRGLGR